MLACAGNSPVTERVETCVRNATAKHAWIVWLLSTGPGMPGAAAAGGLNGVETGPFRP